jgi:hypothetical protein
MAVKTAKEVGAKKAPASVSKKEAKPTHKVIERWRLPSAPPGESRMGFFHQGKEMQLDLVDGVPTKKVDEAVLRSAGLIFESWNEGKVLPPKEDLRQWKITFLHPNFPVVTEGNFALYVGTEERQFTLDEGKITTADPDVAKALYKSGFGELGRVPVEE